MSKKFSPGEFSSAVEVLQDLLDISELDCIRLLNDPDSGEILHLLGMLSQEKYRALDYEIKAVIRRAALDLLKRRKR